MKNDRNEIDSHHEIKEINYIKAKFGFDNIQLERLDYSNNNHRQLNITHSSNQSEYILTTKSNNSSSFVIQPDYRKINQIISRTKRQSLKKENESEHLQSQKYNINAIINMMHSNYKKIVEFNDDDDEEDNVNNNKNNNNHRNIYNSFISSSNSTNDENVSKESYCFLLSSSYKFISSSNNNNNNAHKKNNKIPIIKLLQLQDKSIYTMLYYIYNQYNSLLLSHEFIANKIVLSLTHLFKDSIELFKFTYKLVVELQEFYFKYSQFKKGKYIYPLFDLFLKSKITKEAKANMCYEITFVYNFIKTSIKSDCDNDPREYTQTIKFDIRERRNCLYWFASEFQETKNSIGRVCYSQPITPFAIGDYLLFRINIFNVNGYIDPSSIKWKEALINPILALNYFEYEKKIIKTKLIYDRLRCCEIEQIIHLWKTADQLTNKRTIEEFTVIMKECFELKKIYYDVTNLYLFKICLKAIKAGLVDKNKYSNIPIEVIEAHSSIINECQWMGTLNVKYEMQKIQIRCGDCVVFYISDLYY